MITAPQGVNALNSDFIPIIKFEDLLEQFGLKFPHILSAICEPLKITLASI